MKLYFDTCCYDRINDDHSDAKMWNEYTTILRIINYCRIEGFPVVGSPMLDLEMDESPNEEERKKVKGFYMSTVTEEQPLTEQVEERIYTLQKSKLRRKDAAHLALAEAADVDYLLTVDVDFAKKALETGTKTKVINPINFIQEYAKWLLSLM